ncbi:hypothetical protein K457DRAFT_131812 [Linnemannia elongata AG-77]|uniref:Uncharacterized protein n=1 Tax=Linnemannia elongata AG-77 TaxID=1314771 RepID=A0A197KHJ2_9FUNG|nr:hypothetical protein K457DRAFT_131812 [Linnemannia elongata AG-77]
MAAAVPTLPFVTLLAHKPSAPHEILAATTAITSLPTPAVPIAGGIGVGGPNATAATTMTRSSSSVSLHPPRSVSSDISHLRSASSSAGLTAGGGVGIGISGNGTSLSAGGRLMSVGMLRSSTAPVPQHHNPPTTATTSTTTTTAIATSTSSGLPSALTDLSFPTNTPMSTTVQTRTLHPQVHYIFENDPLETEILESIPKSQCITMDFDPRSGVIKNVESYLTQLQVMDVRLVQSFGQEVQQGQVQGVTLGGSSSSLSPPFASATGTGVGTGGGAGTEAVSSSSSASSLKATTTTSGGGGGRGPADDNRTHSITSPPQPNPSTSSPSSSSSGAPTSGGTLLARTNSLSSSTLQSSFKTSRRSPDKGTRGDTSVSDDKSSSSATTTATTMATKDWTLVIDAVELDRRDQESDSQLLEQSMVSSLDTDSIPEDYILHCDALMKSFSARNLLLRKVIDYANTTTSPTGTPP